MTGTSGLLGSRAAGLPGSDDSEGSEGSDDRTPAASSLPLDRGIPGRSAEAEYRRRLAGDQRRRRQRFGRLAWLADLLADERQSTRAWSIGAEGERRLGAELDQAVGVRGVVLHDRGLPGSRGNVDHLAIAPSGVWVVDAKAYSGRVSRRRAGPWSGSDVRLYVGGRDRSKAFDGVRRQRDAVQRVLEHDVGTDAPPVHAVICIVGADWPWFARPMRFGGTWVTWPRRLGRTIMSDDVLGPLRIEEIARILARRFPAR